MTNTARIDIPPQFIHGIRYISLLSEDDANKLYESLRQIPKGVTGKKYIELFSESYNLDNSKEIAAAVFSFGGLLRDPEMTMETIVEGLSSSFENHERDNASEDQVHILKDRLKYILLLSDNLKIIYEVYDLLSEGNKYLNADVITKTHLIIDTDTQNRFGVIFHRLNLDYKEDGKKHSKEFFLDKDDLRKLKSRIEEAIDREDNIKTVQENFINFIDITA
jgi:hypothetical protein